MLLERSFAGIADPADEPVLDGQLRFADGLWAEPYGDLAEILRLEEPGDHTRHDHQSEGGKTKISPERVF